MVHSPPEAGDTDLARGRSDRVRMLLLQARRPDDPMREHEHRCFVEQTGLPPERIVCHDLSAGPPRVRMLSQFDALTVGGSADFYVSRGNLPDFRGLLDFLGEVTQKGFATFASCFGYQSIVRALGGEIVRDEENAEVGSFELSLTAEGRSDPLLGTLPDRFVAQLGHRERATGHPPGLPNLVSSERSPFQALRVPGRPIWATQFHPELTRRTNTDRFLHYMKEYAPDVGPGETEAALSRFRDSDEASRLMPRFLDLVFG